jgi:sporulation protein YlmC with PRC-barrel domain
MEERTMRIDLETPVHTSDGKDIGKIDKLILDPASGLVRTAVVRKGWFLTDDIEIPVDALEADADGTLRLQYTSEQVDKLPRFFEEQYTAPPVGIVPPLGYGTTGLLWPLGWAGPYTPAPFSPAASDRAGTPGESPLFRQQDLENAVIGEGSVVRALDGEKIGEVQRLTFDTISDRLSSLVVRRGVLLHEDTEVSADLIESVNDGEIVLALTSAEASERLARSPRG